MGLDALVQSLWQSIGSDSGVEATFICVCVCFFCIFIPVPKSWTSVADVEVVPMVSLSQVQKQHAVKRQKDIRKAVKVTIRHQEVTVSCWDKHHMVQMNTAFA